MDRGYFTTGEDGTFLAVTNYTYGYSGLLDPADLPAESTDSGSSSEASQT